jgi:hypothetical protein
VAAVALILGVHRLLSSAFVAVNTLGNTLATIVIGAMGRRSGPKAAACRFGRCRRNDDSQQRLNNAPAGTAVLESQFRGCSQALLYNAVRPHASLGYRPPAPEVFVRVRGVAGCATSIGSAGHAGATASTKPTFHLDHSMKAGQLALWCPPPLPRHFARAALQPADNSAWCSLMQARRFLGSPTTAAHNLCASPEHAARTALGVAASVCDVIAVRTTESSAKRPMPNTHFAMTSPPWLDAMIYLHLDHALNWSSCGLSVASKSSSSTTVFMAIL